jgi:hypothetical protein
LQVAQTVGLHTFHFQGRDLLKHELVRRNLLLVE